MDFGDTCEPMTPITPTIATPPPSLVSMMTLVNAGTLYIVYPTNIALQSVQNFYSEIWTYTEPMLTPPSSWRFT